MHSSRRTLEKAAHSNSPVLLSRRFDHAAAEAAFPVVQHRELTGRDGTLRFIESHIQGAVGAQRRMTGLVGLPIANLDLRLELRRGRLHQPVAWTGGQRTTDEQRVIMPL